jgi:hypothetical protein
MADFADPPEPLNTDWLQVLKPDKSNPLGLAFAAAATLRQASHCSSHCAVDRIGLDVRSQEFSMVDLSDKSSFIRHLQPSRLPERTLSRCAALHSQPCTRSH